MKAPTVLELAELLAECNRKLRINESAIKNFEALVERKVRPLQEKIQEHEEALEIVAETLSA